MLATLGIRDAELRPGDLEGVADAERRQHMRRQGGPAARDEIDRVEVAEREQRREQGANEIEIPGGSCDGWI